MYCDNWIPTLKKMKMDPPSTVYVNSEWIKDPE